VTKMLRTVHLLRTYFRLTSQSITAFATATVFLLSLRLRAIGDDLGQRRRIIDIHCGIPHDRALFASNPTDLPPSASLLLFDHSNLNLSINSLFLLLWLRAHG
jgi:hypothetical protein